MTDELSLPLVEPALAGDEYATLTGFLDYYRVVLARKTNGLTHEQLNRAVAPSTLTLAKLARHLTLVEQDWFHVRFLGLDPPEPWASAPWDDDVDWEMTTAVDVTPEELMAHFHAACAESRRITGEADSLDQLSVQADRTGDHYNLRWILVHMIEEYARHAGHADFLREAIDGVVGD
jgi:hypothetical protein